MNSNSSHRDKLDALLPQLHELLRDHPNLATELPYLLIRMSSGSSVNLSQVPDTAVARGMRNIFQTLGCTSDDNDAWIFDDGGNWNQRGNSNGNGNGKGAALVLVKLTRFLMDDKGITLDAIEQFEQKQCQLKEDNISKGEDSRCAEAASTPDISSEIASLTCMLLDKFQSQGKKDEQSSLAKELFGILSMMTEKESVCLDGIPDVSLKEAMEKLFLVIGLSKEEMDDESDDENEDGNHDDSKVVSFGYVLPEETSEGFDRIKIKIDAAVGACRVTHQKFIQRYSTKRTLGPSFPPPDASNTVSAFDLQGYSDEDDDIGPAPLGSLMARKRRMKGPLLSSTALEQLAEDRNSEMIHVTTGVDPNSSLSNQREEWMMKPGEHDFLKGVLSKGIKSRTFKNEKGGNRDAVVPDAPLDPKIQLQVDSIIKMHEDARGPSLMDQHRERKAEEKVAAKNREGGDWAWSREKDLDDGRRVDKNHLNMVMGGASSNLKSKFQGSYSKL